MRVEFSEAARRYFEPGGWFDGRRIDLTEILTRMKHQGWVVSEAAQSFLEQVHGLTIADIEFQCEDIANRWEVRRAERLTSTTLFPIGHADWLPYFIDDTGHFYWLDSDLAVYASLDDFVADRYALLRHFTPVSPRRSEWYEAAFETVLFKHCGGDVTSAAFRTLVEAMWRLDLLVRRDEQVVGDFKRSWSHVELGPSMNRWFTVVFESAEASFWQMPRDRER